MPGHPLCLREKPGGACGRSLQERDTFFTALPRSMSVEGAAGCPGRTAGAVGLLVWKRFEAGERAIQVSSAPSAERQKPGC